MNKVVSIKSEWQYTPPDYFEEAISISEQGVQLSISNGLAIANIEQSLFEDNPEIPKNLTKAIKSRLQSVQIMSHKDFSLGKPSRTDVKENGSKIIYVEVEPFVCKTSFGNVDLVVLDRDGKIISDTKLERLDKQKWFAETIDKYRSSNDTLDQMLKSYQMAVKDPNNELVHLYEIRDALSKKFGKKKTALKRLVVTQKEWDVIGDLANHSPLKEGRHRGKAAGFMRDAEPAELESARKSTATLIEKYLFYLERLEADNEQL
jgi:hypothetical protein